MRAGPVPGAGELGADVTLGVVRPFHGHVLHATRSTTTAEHHSVGVAPNPVQNLSVARHDRSFRPPGRRRQAAEDEHWANDRIGCDGRRSRLSRRGGRARGRSSPPPSRPSRSRALRPSSTRFCATTWPNATGSSSRYCFHSVSTQHGVGAARRPPRRCRRSPAAATAAGCSPPRPGRSPARRRPAAAAGRRR